MACELSLFHEISHYGLPENGADALLGRRISELRNPLFGDDQVGEAQSGIEHFAEAAQTRPTSAVGVDMTSPRTLFDEMTAAADALTEPAGENRVPGKLDLQIEFR